MTGITNTWLVTLSEHFIGEHSQNPFRFNLTPLNAHLYADNLIVNELDDDGLYAALLNATIAYLLDTTPELAEDPAFPSKLTIVYTNPRRGHISPGADDLVPLATLQPPTVWTVRATLDSPVEYEARADLVITPAQNSE